MNMIDFPIRPNASEFVNVMQANGVDRLYHFTDASNLESIERCGGLLSWADCAERRVAIPRPGGNSLSRDLDSRGGLEHYVRLSFVEKHPMMHRARKDGRIANPVVLEIDPKVVLLPSTLFSNRNATSGGAIVNGSVENFSRLGFSLFRERYLNVAVEFRPFYQAEVLVLNFVPVELILNFDEVRGRCALRA